MDESIAKKLIDSVFADKEEDSSVSDVATASTLELMRSERMRKSVVKLSTYVRDELGMEEVDDISLLLTSYLMSICNKATSHEDVDSARTIGNRIFRHIAKDGKLSNVFFLLIASNMLLYALAVTKVAKLSTNENH